MKYHYEPCPKCRSSGRDNAGDNLAAYVDGSAHCFSCGYHIFPSHYVPKPKEEINYGSKSVLPTSFTREVPSRAWKWLLQYGLPMSHWRDRVGWSEEDSRLVFAIPDIQSVAFSQGRWVSPETPVGTHSERRKWYNWGDSHATAHVVGDYRQGKEVVLVEDWISANKVGQEHVAISLFGTDIPPSVVALVRFIQLPLVLWLDNDQRGSVERKAMRLTMLTGLPTTVRYSQADPKCLTPNQITETLLGG